MPPRLLIPVIAVLCATGGFAVNNSAFDVALIGLLGLVAYLLLSFGLPMAPLVLGLVLGPIVETNLRDALTGSGMDPTVFVTRPVSAVLLALIAFILAWSIRRSRRPSPPPGERQSETGGDQQ